LQRLAIVLLPLLLLLPAAARAGKYAHLVLPGESLSRIAKRYHTSPDRIRKLNRLRSDHLREGQKLKIQSPAPATARVRVRYRVREGESLTHVAKRYKMPLALLRRLNPKARATLRPGQLLWVIKEGPRGSGRDLYRLESGPGFTILEPHRAYGTMLTVTRVAEVLSEHGIHNPGKPPVLVGDISRERGGFLPPHVSHRRGRDVDVRYPLTEATKQYVAATADTLDLKRTWSLIQAFIRTGDVLYVFVDYKLQRWLYDYAKDHGASQAKLLELFQYPRGRRSMSGVIRHEPGHTTHFHLRFKSDSEGKGPNS
jgi:LysM repeat protein